MVKCNSGGLKKGCSDRLDVVIGQIGHVSHHL